MNRTPSIDKTAYIAPGAVISGDVSAGRRVSIWPNAVIRGDEAQIVIGNETNIQDGALLHCGYGFPMQIGSHVTIGHGAIVHGCTIGDHTLIGMGSIILNGAKVGKNCIIGAGALLTEGQEVPDGTVWIGSPARLHREMTAEDMEQNRKNADVYTALAEEYREGRFKFQKA